MPPKRSQKTPPAVLVGTYRKDQLEKSVLTDEEFQAVDNFNEAVFNLYEHAAARNLNTLSPELADMIEDAWKFLQPVKRLELLGRVDDQQLSAEIERRMDSGQLSARNPIR